MFGLDATFGLIWAFIAASITSMQFGLRMNRVIWGVKQRNPANYLCLLLIFVSWLFVFATVLMHLMSRYEEGCTAAFFACALLYASTKILAYMFMLEKVYLATSFGTPRMKHKMFLLNVSLIAPFGVLLVLMLIYGGSQREDADVWQSCRLKLPYEASVPLTTYDTLYTSFLTAQFLRVLWKSAASVETTNNNSLNKSKKNLRAVAVKNAQGSFLSLISTMANLAGLAAMGHHGQSLAACYAFCTIDVLINCFVAHRMSSPGKLFGCFSGRTAHEIDESEIAQMAANGPYGSSKKTVPIVTGSATSATSSSKL